MGKIPFESTSQPAITQDGDILTDSPVDSKSRALTGAVNKNFGDISAWILESLQQFVQPDQKDPFWVQKY